MTQSTLGRRMILQLAGTLAGLVALSAGALLALNGMHQDMSVSVQGYRQLRQLFDVGFFISRARDAISADPPRPQQAADSLRSALAKLDERSDPAAIDGPPAHWVDESERGECRLLMNQSIHQLDNGAGGGASLNLTFAKLSHVADDVRLSIADSQRTADRRQQVARGSIITLAGTVMAVALVFGAWQFRKVMELIRQLVRSEQLASVGYLAASVAHEINNPLGIIAGYAERASQRLDEKTADEITGSTRNALSVISEEAFRCKQITDQLLFLARPGPNQRTLCSLAQIAGTVVPTLSGLGKSEGRQIILTADLAEDFTVRANEGEMKQVLLNLLINSLEAVNSDSGKVTINLCRKNRLIEMSVSDNGAGMTAATMKQLFEPFYSAKQGAGRGTGLGLCIAKTIVAEHGGSIVAQSDGPGPAAGSSSGCPPCRMRWPLDKLDSNLIRKPAHLLRPQVLIVDDESRLRELLLDVIPDMGCIARAARTAEEALRLIEADPPDILILDLNLPGMAGMELLESVRQKWPALQAIILTGFGDLESARRAIFLDAVDFITKPFHLREIEVALDKARSRIANARQSADTPVAASDSKRTLAEVEWETIIAALKRHSGNRTAAASELGISRRKLHYWLSENQQR